MKLTKMDVDNKMSIAEMKQVKAGLIKSQSGDKSCESKVGRDTDKDGTVSDTGF